MAGERSHWSREGTRAHICSSTIPLYPTQGMPPVEDLDQISPFASTMISSMNSGTFAEREDEASVLARFRALITSATDDALQLTRELLAFDPAVRMDVVGALASPYLSQFHNEAAERSASFKVLCAHPSPHTSDSLRPPYDPIPHTQPLILHALAEPSAPLPKPSAPLPKSSAPLPESAAPLPKSSAPLPEPSADLAVISEPIRCFFIRSHLQSTTTRSCQQPTVRALPHT